MATLSVIIPTYKDPFLQDTINSLLENAELDIEVIPVLDGYIPEPALKEDPRVNPIYFKENRGMRAGINAGVAVAKGKFVMKCDSHCAFAKGFDKVLVDSHQEGWLLIPRRYPLDLKTFTKRENRRPIDYHYLSFPEKLSNYGLGIHPISWRKKSKEKSSVLLDDTMTFQGSCWFVEKEDLLKRIGLLSEEKYGSFVQEMIELGMGYWMSGGACKVVKSTWYAHLSKRRSHYEDGLFTIDYKKNTDALKGYNYSASFWLEQEGFKDFIKKFWPIPSWEADWEEQWKKLNCAS